MNKNNEQAHFAVQAAIREKIQASRHAIKLISQMVNSFLKMRSSNLVVIANALETNAKGEAADDRLRVRGLLRESNR